MEFNPFDYVKSSHKNGKKLEVFEEDYIPPREAIIGRDMKIKLILDQMFKNYRNLIIKGDPSTGKTLVVKYIFNTFSESDNYKDYRFIYINCRDKAKQGIYLEILEKLGKKVTTGREISYYPKEINKIIKNQGIKKVYICFDEYDSVARKYSAYKDFLYDFCNTGKFLLILIANTSEWYSGSTDLRSQSRFNPREEKFDWYNKEQIGDILKSRINLGIPKNPALITDNEVETLTEILHSEYEDPLRIGIKTLLELINKKQSDEKELSYEKIKELFDNSIVSDKINSIFNFPRHLKLVVDIIVIILNEKKEPFKETILDYWKNHFDLTKKLPENRHDITIETLSKYIHRLVEFEYIKEEKIRSGKQGAPKKTYHPNFNIERYELKTILQKRKGTSNQK